MPTRLTPAQIAAYARAAGFTGPGLAKAVAVALAESGGNPQAVNTNSDRYRSRDRGLWQINAHWHPEVSDAAAFDPAQAAQAAYRISAGGRDWGQWATWKNGAAAAQMGRAQLAAAGASKIAPGTQNAALNIPGPSLPLDVLPDSLGEALVPATGLAGALSEATGSNPLALANMWVTMNLKTAAWLADPQNWTRILLVAGGSAAVIAGLYMLGRSGAAGQTVADGLAKTGPANLAKTAGAVIPQTRALTAAAAAA